MHRRTLMTALPVAALSAALPVFRPARAQAEATALREFRVLRAGRDIGRHRLSARQDADGFALDIDIELVVRVLGIAAYRYEMSVAERWSGGQLVRLDSKTNDDGTDDFVRIQREGEGLAVDGSGFSGTQPGEAVATTYHSVDLMQRRPWLSSQSGKPIAIDPRPVAGEAGAFAMGGELGNVLIYDSAGDWSGCRFDAGGEPAEYALSEASGSIAGLWQAGS
ncbi:MAG: DUF6134 family protein [Pseudomonadota bacterium]